MSSKSRPITAKTIFYNSDGFGRDTYIQYNNGGLTAPNERKTNFDRGSFPFTKEVKQPYSSIEPKTLLYHSDGSGRDTYITSLNGGFHLANFNSTSVYHTFASSLRSNPRTAIPSRNQRWKSSNMGFSYATKTKDKFYEMSCYQRSQMLRLSQPKRKNTKY